MKVVILCGGFGTRLKEETEFKPKPMVEIGGVPILWHIMKTYSCYGFKDFVLCLGYKGHVIKNYFLNYNEMVYDFTLKLDGKSVKLDGKSEDWNITCVDTGKDSMTGGRVKHIEKYVDDDKFFVSYGDGVSDINIKQMLGQHLSKNKIATITAVHPISRFGEMDISANLDITSFKEKPPLNTWINGGFFVFDKKIFDYLEGDHSILEDHALVKLIEHKQATAFKHEGFWHCMDTYRDFQLLNKIWDSGKAPWKIW